MSRLNSVAKNVSYSLLSQILITILSFISRTYLIRYLGAEYLGINGLFSNIISMLSLAELGVATAITYKLYNPIANNDVIRIQTLMRFYKMVYRFIGIIILVLGLVIIPFLPFFIKENVDFININLVFLIYLLQSISTYIFFAYKSALLRSSQKEYISIKVQSAMNVCSYIIQVLVIKYTQNFIYYLLIVVLFNIIANLIISIIVDRKYPYINNNKNIVKLEKKEIFDIVKDCYALMIYKINSVVLNATDNLVLSSHIGLGVVGIYSNYILVTKAIKSIFGQLLNAVVPSIGNMATTESKDYTEYIFRVSTFLTVWLFGICSTIVFIVIDDFITWWIGGKYTLGPLFCFLISIDLYIYGITKNYSTFRTSLGLFKQAKYRPVFGMIINLIISVVLVNFIGVYGVVLGTLISNILTYCWYDAFIIYKFGFNKSVKKYFIKLMGYVCVYFMSSLVLGIVLYEINSFSLFLIFVKCIICCTVFSFAMILIFYRSYEFVYVKELSCRLFLLVKNKIKNKF